MGWSLDPRPKFCTLRRLLSRGLPQHPFRRSFDRLPREVNTSQRETSGKRQTRHVRTRFVHRDAQRVDTPILRSLADSLPQAPFRPAARPEGLAATIISRRAVGGPPPSGRSPTAGELRGLALTRRCWRFGRSRNCPCEGALLASPNTGTSHAIGLGRGSKGNTNTLRRGTPQELAATDSSYTSSSYTSMSMPSSPKSSSLSKSLDSPSAVST